MIKNIAGKQVEVKVKEGYFELPEKLQNKIKEFWDKCLEDNPNLWDGDVMCISECRIEDDRIIINISGDGFLYNMVRIIVGTLLDVGTGKIKPEEIPEIIKSKQREKAGKTVPAQGLYLVEVKY